MRERNRTKTRSPIGREVNVCQFRIFYQINSCLVYGASIHDPGSYKILPSIDIDDMELVNSVRDALAAIWEHLAISKAA